MSLPTSPPAFPSDANDASGLEDYFRDGAAPADALLWWQLERQEPLQAALRALFQGDARVTRLRLWVFLELMALRDARLTREALNHAFHLLRDEVLDSVLKRLRDADLLAWDATAQTYAVTPLAQQLVGLLLPLTVDNSDADADLAALLAGVAGAHQLGILQPDQLGHLLSQLSRLREEFAGAMTSGSEFQLRRANHRFNRAMRLVNKANDALKAIIEQAQAHGDARLERLARELGGAQASLLAMASQFNRALQQADRQRVTLGSTGVTTTDVRRWLQAVPQLDVLAAGLVSVGLHPVMVAAQELVDGTEAEFERDRPVGTAPEGLPAAVAAPPGELAVMSLPPEMGLMQALLNGWTEAGLTEQPVAPAVLGGSYARAAYRAQLLPLLGDEQARHLQGATGDMARQPWRVRWAAEQGEVTDEFVRWMSQGTLIKESP